MGLAISLIPFFLHVNNTKEIEIVKIKKTKVHNNCIYEEISLHDNIT